MSNAKLVVLYPMPTDTAEFDRAYNDEHIPLMQDKMKGMKAAVTKIEAPAPFYLMAEIWAPSIDAIKAFLGSPDGQEVAGHAARISTGGPFVALFTEEDVYQL